MRSNRINRYKRNLKYLSWEILHKSDDSKNVHVTANNHIDACLMAARHHGCASADFNIKCSGCQQVYDPIKKHECAAGSK